MQIEHHPVCRQFPVLLLLLLVPMQLVIDGIWIKMMIMPCLLYNIKRHLSNLPLLYVQQILFYFFLFKYLSSFKIFRTKYNFLIMCRILFYFFIYCSLLCKLLYKYTPVVEIGERKNII